jgi:hypothetical protein
MADRQKLYRIDVSSPTLVPGYTCVTT